MSASAALAAPASSVNVTQFSKTVSGVAPSGVTGVTVDLLRNTQNSSGATVRNQVDSFTATPNATTGQWSGAFTTHPVSGDGDQVQVNYTGGTGVTTPITIAGNGSLSVPVAANPTTGVTPGATANVNWSDLDNSFGISFDGKTLQSCLGSYCGDFTASVNGGAAQSSTAGSLTFATPVTNTASVAITTQTSDGAGDVINVTTPGPQLAVQDAAQTGSYNVQPASLFITGLPSCSAYLGLSEVTCSGLVPGSYKVTDGSSSQTATVPAAVPQGDQTGQGNLNLFVPSELGVTVPGLAAGQTVTVTPVQATGTTGVTGTAAATTLTVHTLTVGKSTPLGDLLNGSNTTVTGTCSTGLFFGSVFGRGSDACVGTGATAAFPSPNNLAGANPTALLDDSSLGSTDVLLPSIPFGSQAPNYGDSIMTPYTVTAFPRYTDPLAQVAADNVPRPQVGPAPIVPSTPSADPVTFSYAPLGSSTFTTLGNVNTAAGLTLPASLPRGSYDGRFTLTDPAGNFSSSDVRFSVQGPSSAPAPALPSCKAANRSTRLHGIREVADAAKKGKSHHKKGKSHKKKKRSGSSSAKITCTGAAGTRVVTTASQGSSIKATGTGTIKTTSTSITYKGLAKGKYSLVEIYYYSNGQSSEATQTLTVNSGPSHKAKKHKKHKKKHKK